MSVAEKFSILILLSSAAAQLTNRFFVGKYIRTVFCFGVFAQFCWAFYVAFLQYGAWKISKISVFLLPPYKNWSYFLSYVGWRIFLPLALALFSAFVLKFVCEFLNRRFGERFLEEEEGWLLALGVFLAGYPGFLFYIPMMLVAGIFMSFFYRFFGKERAPLFYAWLPVAVFAILLTSWIPKSVLGLLII